MTQTALTRQQVLNASDSDLNVMVAEHIFGWRRITGPTHDYDGPVEHGEVLVPPNMSEAHAYAMMPPRGKIPLSYFINRNWSQDISAAYMIGDRFNELDDSQLKHRFMRELIDLDRSGGFGRVHASPSDRCKAALLAVLDL